MKENLLGVDIGGTKCAVIFGVSDGDRLTVVDKERFATTEVNETISHIENALDAMMLPSGQQASYCPKFAALVSAMPGATIGGVSLILYGMISAVGVRNVVENKVDFTNTRNVIIAALILVLAIGINYAGSIQIGIVSLSGLAVASIVGILLNAILPGKDYEFGVDSQGDTSVNFKV